jgi:serine/threonine protein kinase
MKQEPQNGDDFFQAGRFQPPTVEELNEWIPDYEFLEFIDRGGMGAVYQARQKALNRVVAVKLLPPALQGRRAFSARFLREARALAKLSHRNIVAIYDYGEIPDRCLYYAMEYVKGTNLRQLMRREELNSRQMLTIITQICEALQYAHERKVVHRDVKPANVLIDERGIAKVADFGLAKILGSTPDGQGLTAPSDALGTPDYMAPETFIRDHDVDHRADIYSLGVMLYEMLTGHVPKGAWEPPSRAAGADVRLDIVVSRALQANPVKRYQSVSEVSRVLEGLLEVGAAQPSVREVEPLPPVSRHRPMWVWSAGLLMVLLCFGGGAVLIQRDLPFSGGGAVVPAEPVAPDLGPVVSPESKQRVLARWVLSYGGMINITQPLQADRLMGDTADIRDPEQLPEGGFTVWRVSMADAASFNDEDLAGLVKLCEDADTVSNLNLHGAQIEPSSLALLIKLAPTLTHLRLTDTGAFTEESMHYLKACNNLTQLFVTTGESDPLELDVADDIRLVQKMQALLPQCRITVE